MLRFYLHLYIISFASPFVSLAFNSLFIPHLIKTLIRSIHIYYNTNKQALKIVFSILFFFFFPVIRKKRKGDVLVIVMLEEGACCNSIIYDSTPPPQRQPRAMPARLGFSAPPLLFRTYTAGDSLSATKAPSLFSSIVPFLQTLPPSSVPSLVPSFSPESPASKVTNLPFSRMDRDSASSKLSFDISFA